MHDDFYQMYLDEVDGIIPCSTEEEQTLLPKIKRGDNEARRRLMEGSLSYIAELAAVFANRGLPMGDLVQEANIALIMAVDSWENGDFKEHLKLQVDAALSAAIEAQETEANVEEEMLARVNVLKDISGYLAQELGREASVEELAKKMKMTVDEIKDIMKLTLDAMSVSPGTE